MSRGTGGAPGHPSCRRRRGRGETRNRPTRDWRSAAILVSSAAAFCVSDAPSLVLEAAEATPTMFWAISVLPLAASPTLREISLVVAVCSSTALAMVFEMSLI